MSKNKILILTLLLTLSFSLISINFHLFPITFAEANDVEILETTTISNTTQGHIEVEAILGTQQVLSKKIPIIVSYTPNVEGRKAYLNLITPSGLEVSDSTVWVPIEKGKTVTKRMYVTPKQGGNYSVSIEAIVYGYDVNYGDSTTVQFTISEKLVMKENSSTYYLTTVLLYLVLIVFVVVSIFFIIKILPKLITKFKRWLLNDSSISNVKNEKEIEDFYKKLNKNKSEEE